MSHLYYSSFQGDTEFVDLSDETQSIDFVSMCDDCISFKHSVILLLREVDVDGTLFVEIEWEKIFPFHTRRVRTCTISEKYEIENPLSYGNYP